MTINRIEALLESLKAEIKKGHIDQQTSQLLTEFETEISPYLDNKITEPHESLLDKAKKLEVDFAQQHPTAEGIMQEIVANLGKMGI